MTSRLPLHEQSLAQLEELFRQELDTYPDYSVINSAYEFAKTAHGGQMRDNGGPYVMHMLRMVITMFSDFHIKDRNMLVAALLHDVVEDTEVTIEEIEDKFGEKAAEYVASLTRARDKSEDLHPNDKFAAKKAKYEYYLQAPFKIRQLKLFDLIDNMGDWKYFPEGHPTTKKYPRWLHEYQTYVLPLAESIGPRYVEPVKAMLAYMDKQGYKAMQGNYEA